MLHVFRVIADFIILMDPTRAFVCNLHTSDGMSFSSNPSVVKFFTRELVTSPVAPRTIGTMVYVYSGYILFKPTVRATYRFWRSFSFFWMFWSKGTHTSMTKQVFFLFLHTTKSGLLCLTGGHVLTTVSHQISTVSEFHTWKGRCSCDQGVLDGQLHSTGPFLPHHV